MSARRPVDTAKAAPVAAVHAPGPGVTITAVDSTGSLVPTEPLASVAAEFPPIPVGPDEELLMSYYIPVAPLQAFVASVSRDSAARLFETTLR